MLCKECKFWIGEPSFDHIFGQGILERRECSKTIIGFTWEDYGCEEGESKESQTGPENRNEK